MTFTLIVLGVAIILFVSDRVRLDVIAMGALLALLVSGTLTVGEALAGFAAPVVLLIASLFFVGDALSRTGIAHHAAQWLARVGGGSEWKLLTACMLVAAVLSAFMSNTGAVAVLIPVVLGVTRGSSIHPGRLLIPLSIGAMLGGMLTLIGTPPNMIASGALEAAGLEPFGFFGFTPIGLALLAAGVLYCVLVGRRVLPDRAGEEEESEEIVAVDGSDLVEEYRILKQARLVRVRHDSPMRGKRLRDVALRERHDLEVLAVFGEVVVRPDSILRGVIVVQGPRSAIEECGFELLPWDQAPQVDLSHMEAAELMLPRRSRLIGQTLIKSRFRERYGLQVVAILRKGEPIEGALGRIKLRFGDLLFVRAPAERISSMQSRRLTFIVVSQTTGARRPPASARAPIALAVVAAMLVVMALGLLPTTTTALLAAFAMVITGCVRLPMAYRAVNWQSLMLIAAMLPMATALDKTGGLDAIVKILVENLGDAGDFALLAGLYWTAGLLSLVMSNTATAVLLVPVAVQAAKAVDASPHAFAMTVALACSCAFSTPMATPTNTMVLTPGGYRFSDYLKVGVPLQIVVFLLTMLLVPLLYPA